MKSIMPALLSFLVVVSAAQAGNVPTQKLDGSRSGATLNETVLTLANVNSNTFGKVFERPVTGDMYPQPLIVENLTIAGGTHNVVFLATADNNVYAYDATVATNTSAFWAVNLGAPCPAADVQCCCTDISLNVGIIGTPVIDTVSKTLFLVTKNKNADATYHQWVHALDLATGAEKFGGPREVTAVVPGTGAGSVNGQIAFDPKLQLQRPGLLLQGGRVFIAWASHNDCGNYHGWVMAYDASTLNQVAAWNATPNGKQAGIWMSGGGLVGDGTRIYLTTGNGDSDEGSGGGSDYGQSFVGMDNNLIVQTWFQSGFYNTLNTGDKDLGGCGVSFIPGTRFLVSGGKDGKLYLVNADSMGGYGGNRQDACVQTFSVTGGHFHGGPVSFNSPAGMLTYIWAEGDYLKAFRFSNGLYQTTPFWQGVKAPTGMPGGQQWVSANGSSNGIVWSTIPWSGDANHATVPGVLRAANAVTGAEIYNSHQNTARDDFGSFAKNPSPLVNAGLVYVPTFSGKLAVYGLLSTNPPPPPPPPGNGTGLTGNYYSDVNLGTLALTRVDPTVNFDWGNGSPGTGVPNNNFSVRWTGSVQPQFTQAYTFYTVTDDGVRLWVNDVLLIDKWVPQNSIENSGTISLNAGQLYSIRMEYYDGTRNAVAKLSWSSLSIPKAIIPQTQLYP